MRKQHPPKRRSVLRVEELFARSLPAVLNPAVDIVGDIAIVSSAEDVAVDDSILDSESTDSKIEESVDLLPEESWGEATTVEGTDESVNIRFKPISFSELPIEGSEIVEEADPMAYEMAACGIVPVDLSSNDQAPSDEISADGTDATATTDDEAELKILPYMTYRGGNGAQSSEEGGEETTIESTEFDPAVCYFGGINQRNLTDSTDAELVDPSESDKNLADCDYPVIELTNFEPIFCYAGDVDESKLTDSIGFSIEDGKSTDVDESLAPITEVTDSNDETKPNILFRTLNWGGMTEEGAADDVSNTEVVEDPSVLADDGDLPVSGDEITDSDIQTFGGLADDEIRFLAYSSMPPVDAAPLVAPVAPTKAEVITQDAAFTIDGSAWTFYATKHEEVISTPTAQTAVGVANKIAVVPPTTQSQSNEAPASSTLGNSLISLDGSSVKKLLGALSVDQK